MHPDIEAYLANNPVPQSIDVLIADSNGILRGKHSGMPSPTRRFPV